MPTALKQETKAAASAGGQWTLGPAFNEVYEHHGSMKALWEKKWRFPVSDSTETEPRKWDAKVLLSVRRAFILSMTASSKILKEYSKRS